MHVSAPYMHLLKNMDSCDEIVLSSASSSGIVSFYKNIFEFHIISDNMADARTGEVGAILVTSAVR